MTSAARGSDALTKSGTTQSPVERDHEADSSHVAGDDRDDPVAEPLRPVAIAGADRLADEGRAGERETDARHVGNRGEDRDDLRRRAVDDADLHLHQLKERRRAEVGAGRHRHRQPERDERDDAARSSDAR